MRTVQEDRRRVGPGMLSMVAVLALLALLTVPPARGALAMEMAAPLRGGCADGGWTVLTPLEGFVVEDLAVAPDGEVFLTGVVAQGNGTTRFATARSRDGGARWEWVDVYSPAPAASAGGHALYAAAGGSVYALGWERVDGLVRPLLRKSDRGGFGTWWTSFTGENGQRLGALAGDGAGQVYLALGHGPGAVGWVLQSAFQGEGLWTVEDDYRSLEPRLSFALPRGLAVDPDHGLVAVGQLNGDPDRWVVRHQPSSGAAWETVDRFEYSPSAYGLAPATVAFAGRGRRLVVSGYGVAGNGEDDYHWLSRWARVPALDQGRGQEAWRTSRFQLEPGRSSFALDSATDLQGRLLVAGTAEGRDGSTLVVRRSSSPGRWEPLLELPGLSSRWQARVAVGPDGRVWAAAMAEGAAVVLACTP